MSTLYRDYRPQKFSEVLGQNHIKITLQNEIEAGRPASAYLFCGPRAVGKTTLARVLAKAVNCEQRKNNEYEPCNTCASCLSITSGKNLDVIEIDAASNTGVDNVRENIIAFSRLAPGSSKFKVFIIDEVHMLSLSAFNALLKIIEEPPAYAMFILCTTEIQKVPGTVISRCERYDFKRISVKEIVKKLAYIASNEKISIDAEVLEAVARRSGGYLRDAESLLGKIFSLGDKEITREQAELVMPHYNSNEAISLLDYLSRKDAAKAVALINNLMDSGVNVKVFTMEIIELLRKVMLNKLSPELVDNLGLDLGENLEKHLAQVTGTLNWDQVFSFTERFLKISGDYRGLSIPQLPLELAVTELCLESTKFSSPLSPSKPNSSLAPSKSNTSPLSSPSSPSAKFNPFLNKSDDAIKTENFSKAEKTVELLSPEPVELPALNSDLTIADIIDKWPEFLIKIKKYNHSLSFVLQNCEPREIKSNNLFLIFKYKFHHDRINDPSIKKIVETTLREVFGDGLSFSSLIDESLEIKRPEVPLIANASVLKAVSGYVTGNGVELNKNLSNNLIKVKSESPIDSKPASSQPSIGLLSDLLKTFGGEVVN